MIRTLTSLLIGFLLMGGSIIARTIEIPVSRLAVISSGNENQDTNLGQRVCIKFDLPDEIRDAEIGYAGITLNFGRLNVPDDSILVFDLFALTSDWDENSNWDSFSEPGGDVDGDFQASSAISPVNPGEVSIDMTSIAKAWVSGIIENRGVLAIPILTSTDGFSQFNIRPEILRNLITLRIRVPGRE